MSDDTSNAGAPMPVLIYGTAWKKERTAELVALALEAGFRGVDTAGQPKHYDEAGVGAGLAVAFERGLRRKEVFVQTKFSPPGAHDPLRIPYDPHARPSEQVAQSFASSLHNLQTDYVDSLVLHSPLATNQRTLEVWHAMESLVDRGSVRRIGISNCYDLDDLRFLHDHSRVKPVVVQNRFHAQTGYDREIRAFCADHGMKYQSFWTLTANPDVLAHQQVRAIAAAHRRTPAQVLFRFLIHGGTVPLTGTKTLAHMREDLAVCEFDLDPLERSTIDALLVAHRAPGAPFRR
jgi:diketogulonate reductase-like aldo/keto reductase